MTRQRGGDRRSWRRAGDVVRRDEDGDHYYVGGGVAQIRRSGEDIASREIEDVVDGLSGVEESAVIQYLTTCVARRSRRWSSAHPKGPEGTSRSSDRGAQRSASGNGVTERDVVNRVADVLAAKVPRYVEFVDSFPKTPSERTRRAELAEREAKREDHGWDRERECADWNPES